MNNEDKILAMLENLQKGQAETNQRLNSLEQVQASLQADISDVKDRVVKIEIAQENIIIPNIKLLAEGHSGIVSKLHGLEELPERVEDIQSTVDVLKYVFKEHTQK